MLVEGIEDEIAVVATARHLGHIIDLPQSFIAKYEGGERRTTNRKQNRANWATCCKRKTMRRRSHYRGDVLKACFQ